MSVRNIINIAPIIESDVKRALAEDIGSGDVTASLIDSQQSAQASIICKEIAVMCGQTWADNALQSVSPSTQIEWQANDGDMLKAGQTICQINGLARDILTAERTALNFLQTLSGTATHTRKYVDAVAGTQVTLLDTRKTLPGLRAAQKYAVRCGGGQNHRHGLYDAFLLKENHIRAAGSIPAAIQAAHEHDSELFVEIEVENLSELEQALIAKPDRILLDNFSLIALVSAVELAAGTIPLEASGNITLANIRQIAETGVDFISLGTLTKDVKAIDFSLLFDSNINS